MQWLCDQVFPSHLSNVLIQFAARHKDFGFVPCACRRLSIDPLDQSWEEWLTKEAMILKNEVE